MTLIRRRFPVSRAHDLGTIFDDFFNDLSSPVKNERSFVPAISLKEDKESYLLEAELAGMNKDDIDISIKDHVLHLKGEKRFENEEKGESFHTIERSFGSFYREIPLGSDANDDEIKAQFEDGLLKVRVGKHVGPEKGHRRIDIA